MCPFCRVAVHDNWYHLLHCCPPAYVALLRAARALWLSPPIVSRLSHTVRAPLDVVEGLTLCDTKHSLAYGVQLGVSTPDHVVTADSVHVLSLTGMWRAVGQPEHRGHLTEADRARIMRRVLHADQALWPHQNLIDFLVCCRDTIAGRPLRWIAPRGRNTPHSVVWHPAAYMSMPHSALLNVVLRAVPWNRVYCAASSVLPLPAPAGDVSPLYVICALGPVPVAEHTWAVLPARDYPHLFLLPSHEVLHQVLHKYGPVRVVHRSPGTQVVITHGVPWDATLLPDPSL